MAEIIRDHAKSGIKALCALVSLFFLVRVADTVWREPVSETVGATGALLPQAESTPALPAVPTIRTHEARTREQALDAENIVDDFPQAPAQSEPSSPGGARLALYVGEPEPEEIVAAWNAIPGAQQLVDDIIGQLREPALAASLDLGRLPQDSQGFAIVTEETLQDLVGDPALKSKLDKLIELITLYVSEASFQAE